MIIEIISCKECKYIPKDNGQSSFLPLSPFCGTISEDKPHFDADTSILLYWRLFTS